MENKKQASLNKEEATQLVALLDKCQHVIEFRFIKEYASQKIEIIEEVKDLTIQGKSEEEIAEFVQSVSVADGKSVGDLVVDMLVNWSGAITSMTPTDIQAAKQALHMFYASRAMKEMFSGGSMESMEEDVLKAEEEWKQRFANIPEMLTFIDEQKAKRAQINNSSRDEIQEMLKGLITESTPES